MTHFNVPGDREPPWHRPEIVAAEQRILTAADALLAWMRTTTIEDPKVGAAVIGFMTHSAPNPLCNDPRDLDKPVDVTVCFLEKMDRDANRLLLDLLRAAYERRCWQVNYGERRNLDHV